MAPAFKRALGACAATPGERHCLRKAQHNLSAEGTSARRAFDDGTRAPFTGIDDQSDIERSLGGIMVKASGGASGDHSKLTKSGIRQRPVVSRIRE